MTDQATAPSAEDEREGSYFADGTKRIQRNFGITEGIAEWLRVASFKTHQSQSALAREAFDDLREKYEREGVDATV